MKRYICLRFVFFSVIIEVPNGDLLEFPKDTTAYTGSEVRFNCTTDGQNEINWRHGTHHDRMADVYIKGQGIVKPYSRTNRHSIDENPETGRYDLIIRNVSKEDEGIYVCREKGSRGTPPEARLTVIGGQSRGLNDLTAIHGTAIVLAFKSCKSGPFYIDRVPVGKTDADDIYSDGNLLNDYASSGRFEVTQINGHCNLNISNVQTSDAGTYTCRENSGLGSRHDLELLAIERSIYLMMDVSRMDFNSSLDRISFSQIDIHGHPDPLMRWRKENCNKSLCGVSNMTLVHSSARRICHVNDVADRKSNCVSLICALWDETTPGCEQEGSTEQSVTESQCMTNGTTGAPGSWKPYLICAAIAAVVVTGICIVGFLVMRCYRSQASCKRKMEAKSEDEVEMEMACLQKIDEKPKGKDEEDEGTFSEILTEDRALSTF